MFRTVKQFTRRLANALTLRRFEAAETNRLNSAHWKKADGASLNSDLTLDLVKLRQRAIHEAENNPFVAGVIDTHTIDVVGPDGPGLQVISDKSKYNDALEAGWAEWWASPDINGQLSGADFIRQWIHQLWTCGEFLTQILTDSTADTDVACRLYGIHPRRLIDPVGGMDTRLGIKTTDTGKPISYFVQEFDSDGLFQISTKPLEIPAGDIIHGFRAIEPNQLRGFPWLAPSLPAVADLRDYDVQVLDAARAAASNSVFLYTDHPDAPFLNVNESVSVPRNTISMAPPGWKPDQMQAHQPMAIYADYRRERFRDLGRAVNMPLMTVMLDSSQHNYSSARFDGQIYQRGIKALQAWIERIALSRLLAIVTRELELAGRLPTRPASVKPVWTWTPAPHVDPQKEANALDTKLKNHSATLTDALAADGKELETHIAQLKREREMLIEAGINPDPVNMNGAGAPPADGETPAPMPAAKRAEIEAIVEAVLDDRELYSRGLAQ